MPVLVYLRYPIHNDFSGGTAGVTITAGNSGGASGDAFDSVTKGANSILRYTADGRMEFSTAAVSSESNFTQWSTRLGTVSEVYGDFDLEMAAIPSSSASIVSTVLTSAVRFRLQITSAGKLRVLNASSGSVTTSTTTLVTGVRYRIQFRAVHSATVGQSEVRLYDWATGTLLESPMIATGQDFGGSTADRIRFGSVSNQTTCPTMYIGNIVLNVTNFPAVESTGQTVTIGQAAETSTANPVTRSKVRAASQATDTSTGQPITALKTRLTGQAAEADIGTVLGRSKARAAGQAAEIGTVGAVGRTKTRIAGRATETGLAQAVARAKHSAVSGAVDSSAATAVNRIKLLILGPAEQADSAHPVRANRSVYIGQAATTDVAGAITPGSGEPARGTVTFIGTGVVTVLRRSTVARPRARSEVTVR